jgi:hypothetical protein
MDIIKHFWNLIHVERQKEIITVYALTSQMTPMKTIRRRLLQLFTDKLAVNFLMLQDKHNMRTFSLINLHSLRHMLEKLAKGLLFYQFLKLIQINYIISDNLRTLYIYRQRHNVIDVTLTYYFQNHFGNFVITLISSPLIIKISIGEIKGKLYRLPRDENNRGFSEIKICIKLKTSYLI